jgi:hypothetical protein
MIQMDLKNIGYVGAHWIQVAQERSSGLIFLIWQFKFEFHKTGSFLTS